MIRQNREMLHFEHWDRQRSPRSPRGHGEQTPPKTHDVVGSNGTILSARRIFKDKGTPALMKDAMNHTKILSNRDAERSARMRAEKPFADLVARTQESAEASRAERQIVSARVHRGNSSQA